MRKQEREITDKQEIDAILKEATICRVALFDDDYPYIVPMNYGYRDDAIYFHCAKEGRKIDLIKKNPNVGFEIEGKNELFTHEISCRWTTHYQSIFGKGSMELISDFEGKKLGLDIIMEHHGKMDNHYNDKAIEHVQILKLNIESLTGKQSG